MKKSELICNPDGSIYHLALRPGDLATNIITVGDQDRVGEVSKHFDSIELKRTNREFVTHTGMLGGKRLSVISTGIGTDNIDIVLNEIHCLFNKDLKSGASLNHQSLNFIRLGTSGTVRSGIEIDSILASQGALGYDGLLHFYENSFSEIGVNALLEKHPALKALPKPYFTEADPFLMKHFEKVYSRKGITITAPGFYAPQGRSVNAPTKIGNFANALGEMEINGVPITNLEMETAGIYGLSQLFGHKAISISAILANRITGTFSSNPGKIVERMIENALEKISELH